MTVAPILVTGATGRIGRRVVEALVADGTPVRAVTRTPAEAALPASVEVVSGDLTVPASLDAALQGVGTAFLLWPLPLDTAPDVVERLATQVERIVLLTSPHRTPHPFFQQANPAASLHAELERLVTDSGVATTVIRPGMFASNALYWWAAAIKAGGPVRWPYGAAETAPIDERDVGAVIARVLADDHHGGADYVLTGPESLSQAEQVRILGTAVGRNITLDDAPPDEFRREAAGSWPLPVLNMLMAAWAATMGQPAYVTSTVADVLGRPARTFGQWAVDHADAFRS
jgi:uncharacterized protein YbjT (DUF2867 family)